MAENNQTELQLKLEELELEDFANVQDDIDAENNSAARFTITSYGADYTVDSLVKRMNSEAFFVPPFQRMYVWNQSQASRFIESLLLGLPVPGIFVFKEKEGGKHLIIDGQQRLKTLQFFYGGAFGNKVFRLTEVREPWKGKTYSELPEEDRLLLDDSVIHTTVFRQDQPEEDDQSVYEVFSRINTGGVKLSAQEIRTCVNYGLFTDLLSELNNTESWRKIYGAPSVRMKDQELILRFLALLNDADNYNRPLAGFLNNFLARHRQLSKEVREKFVTQFKSAIDVALACFGEKAFRPERSLNAAVYDAVMVGIATRLARGEIANLQEIASSYAALLQDAAFQASYTKSTADEEQVRHRLSAAIEAFQSVE